MRKCRHKFKPRYDERWTTVVEEILDKGKTLERVGSDVTKPFLKERKYIYDICVKCGRIVKRI